MPHDDDVFIRLAAKKLYTANNRDFSICVPVPAPESQLNTPGGRVMALFAILHLPGLLGWGRDCVEHHQTSTVIDLGFGLQTAV
jgi:hypothetical protein